MGHHDVQVLVEPAVCGYLREAFVIISDCCLWLSKGVVCEYLKVVFVVISGWCLWLSRGGICDYLRVVFMSISGWCLRLSQTAVCGYLRVVYHTHTTTHDHLMSFARYGDSNPPLPPTPNFNPNQRLKRWLLMVPSLVFSVTSMGQANHSGIRKKTNLLLLILMNDMTRCTEMRKTNCADLKFPLLKYKFTARIYQMWSSGTFSCWWNHFFRG